MAKVAVFIFVVIIVAVGHRCKPRTDYSGPCTNCSRLCTDCSEPCTNCSRLCTDCSGLCTGCSRQCANCKKCYKPPHCTQIIKRTDYVTHFKFAYPVAFIPPGCREAFQKMYCVNPPEVYKAVTIVCDWAAPPQVAFTLGDEYVHIIRQDPTHRYRGKAVIMTCQLCGHIACHVVNSRELVVYKVN